MSTSVNDPLLASALALSDGRSAVLFIACDLILVPRSVCLEARQRIEAATGVAAQHIVITATHTHSGPVTAQYASNLEDKVVPPPDADYLTHVADAIVRSGCEAFERMRPAEVVTTSVVANGLGTNRHDPAGPAIPQTPVLLARGLDDRKPIAVMCVCTMHPTVLHEDSTCISGDFPGLGRRYLQTHGYDCPIVYHMGAAGNQSPRHSVSENTLAETQRLGELLGQAIVEGLAGQTDVQQPAVHAESLQIKDLPRRDFPDVEEAERRLHAATQTYEKHKAENAAHTTIRSAEVDCFGASETLTLSRLESQGKLDGFAKSCLPAEINVIGLGSLIFVGWPGEVFVEFALSLKQHYPSAHVMTLSNGDLQGYVVTKQAVENGAYEAGNALFRSPEVGDMLVDRTCRLLEAWSDAAGDSAGQGDA